jgi:L-ascorbate metabolism protein UlaG (beta-lactamase superfamily)
MIEPVLQDEAFLADVAAARAAAAGTDHFHLWWLGQSGFLLQWRGYHLLLDPYLSDSLTRKYAGSERPHVRMTARVVDPARLDFVDVVTSSHAHSDHLDPETLRPLLRVNRGVHLVAPEANRALIAERLGIDPSLPLGVDDGTTAIVGELRITGVAAAHETIERDEQGHCRFLGYLLRLGPWSLYHSGDCVPYEGMAGHVRRLAGAHPIHAALLPINGSAPERGVAGNFTGPQAARLALDLGARMVIPMHYEMFTFNTASPTPFAEEAERIGQDHRVLRCGERWCSEELAGTPR